VRIALNQNGQRWESPADLDLADPDSDFACQVEALFDGKGYFDILGSKSMSSMRAVIFVLKRREDPNLRMAAVYFKPSELEVLDADEDEAGPDPKDEKPGGSATSESPASSTTTDSASLI